MDQQQALNVLVQAVELAQSKGAFSLKEAAMVAEATGAFMPGGGESEPLAAVVGSGGSANGEEEAED